MVTTGEATVTHLGITYSTKALVRQPGTPLETCPDCQGSGELYTRKCRNCNGRGLVGGRTTSKPEAER
jgi:DnaJ-class molecular chaperone